MKRTNFILPFLLLCINFACCSNIQTTNEALNKRVLEIEKRQSVCEKKTSEMEKKMGEMEHRLNKTSMVLPNTSHTVTYNTKDRPKTYSTHVGKLNHRAQQSVNVAFSTLLSYIQTHIGLGQIIKFDRVLLNDGSGYSTYSGVFTVPVSGVYLFSYFIDYGGESSGQVWMELMHNGNVINGAVTDSLHNWQDLQGGNLAIVSAQAGDTFWIQSFHQNDAKLYGDNGFTSFSGVLLY